MEMLTPEEQFKTANREHDKAKAGLKRRGWRRWFAVFCAAGVLAATGAACAPSRGHCSSMSSGLCSGAHWGSW